jgi:hypothetical protein
MRLSTPSILLAGAVDGVAPEDPQAADLLARDLQEAETFWETMSSGL